ncbi:MAG TPA: HD domain-containing protein [Phycisphaerae bacterium]|nr:HD domain-containing protein [Phycisphaerae bacterium]
MAEDRQDAPGATQVAAIDIGSNSIRMEIAEVLPDGEIKLLERAHRAVHLGQDTFVTGRLGTQTMNAAISILADFKRMLEACRVGQVRAVATSAVREAGNVDAFLDRAYIACGLDVEVISPSEESRLKVSAVREALKSAPGIGFHDALVVEIGGGTALLTVLHEGQIVTSESHRLGSIRLQEALSIREVSAQKTPDLIRHQIAGVVASIKASLPMKKIDTFFAVGGDARFASAQIGKPTASADLFVIRPKKFDRLVAKCEGLSVTELVGKYGLTHAEAEKLVPALLVYQALIHETAARQIIASHTSMRDGLLLDLARSVTGREDEELVAGIVRSARAFAAKYRCETAHSEHVAELSVRLFDELQAEHGLRRRERLLLHVAALLHEAGTYVSGRAHHKHSYYLIANGEVFGLNAEEIRTIALVARYHRRACPRPAHVEYVSLPRETRSIVSKLAAVLRVADALDRGHAQQVRNWDVLRRPGEMVIQVRGTADLTLERRAMAGKADLFEDVYGMAVRLEEAPLAKATDQAWRDVAEIQ